MYRSGERRIGGCLYDVICPVSVSYIPGGVYMSRYAGGSAVTHSRATLASPNLPPRFGVPSPGLGPLTPRLPFEAWVRSGSWVTRTEGN